MAVIALSAGPWQARIAPEVGGALLAFAFEGRAVLRPATPEALAEGAARKSACFPMVPYANRIARGRFRLDGREYELAPNFPESPHTLHGTGWRRAWSVAFQDEANCVLSLEHSGDADWPFAFSAQLRYELGGDGLRMSLLVANTDRRTAPLGAGFHPYFPRRGGDWLRFTALGASPNDETMLPGESLVVDPLWDYSEGRLVTQRALDNDFIGWAGEAAIGAEDGPTWIMRAESGFPLLRVFTPPERDFFAVEPVSHGANAINRPSGMALLAPGETLSASVVIGVAS